MKIPTHIETPNEKTGLGLFPKKYPARINPKKELKLLIIMKQDLVKEGLTFCTAFKCYVL